MTVQTPQPAAAGKPQEATMKYLRLLAVALATGSSLLQLPSANAQMTTPQMTTPSTQRTQPTQNHPYVGMWVTTDGYIRHELLPNGRYDEARGARVSAYRGRYEVQGNHIDYWDDTGFTADGPSSTRTRCIMAA